MHYIHLRKKAGILACFALSGVLTAGIPAAAEDAAQAAADATEVQTESMETQPETQQETQAETQLATQPETYPENQDVPPTEIQTETQPGTEDNSSAETKTETQTPEVDTEPIPEQSEKEIQTEKQELQTEYPEASEQPDNAAMEPEEEPGIQPELPEDQETAYYSPYSSNSELIAHQHITESSGSYRTMFTHIDAEYALLKAGTAIYEEKNNASRQVGTARTLCTAAIISDRDDEWVYIESGKTRGFVDRENLITGKTYNLIVCRKNTVAALAESLIPYYENRAFLYTMKTAQQVEAQKVCSLAAEDLHVYDSIDIKERSIVGELPKNAIAYLLTDEGQYAFIESGSVRGFVDKSRLITGRLADEAENILNGAIPVAEETVSPSNNKAYYYTLTFVDEPDPNIKLRSSIVDYALQFVGNPYVWGGTSLTNGADCSGFVQSIYAHFGYSLPRVACDQAGYGKQITLDSAQPGDLIFYARNGYVYHVSMYIGDGRVVQAYSSDAGIITSDIGCNAVWATTIL